MNTDKNPLEGAFDDFEEKTPIKKITKPKKKVFTISAEEVYKTWFDSIVRSIKLSSENLDYTQGDAFKEAMELLGKKYKVKKPDTNG